MQTLGVCHYEPSATSRRSQFAKVKRFLINCNKVVIKLGGKGLGRLRNILVVMLARGK